MSGGQQTIWSDTEVLDVLWAHKVKRQTASQLALTYGATRNAIVGLVHRIATALPDGGEDALTDEDLLYILDAVRGQGVGATKVGTAYGLSRNAVLALVHRLMAEVAGPGAAQKPENRNGGMPRHWWLDGIEQRGRAA